MLPKTSWGSGIRSDLYTVMAGQNLSRQALGDLGVAITAEMEFLQLQKAATSHPNEALKRCSAAAKVSIASGVSERPRDRVADFQPVNHRQM